MRDPEYLCTIARMSLRASRHLIALALLISAMGASPNATHYRRSPLANAVVLVIRHAEKPASGAELAPAGQQRAAAYVGYLEHYRIDGKPFKVSHIFATADTKKSHRERLTVAPYAQALGMAIDQRFKNADVEALAQDLNSNDYGKDILICWHHGEIPALLKALGADAKTLVPEKKWPDDVFDRVIEIHFDADGHVDPKASRMVLEHLMPGDETGPAN